MTRASDSFFVLKSVMTDLRHFNFFFWIETETQLADLYAASRASDRPPPEATWSNNAGTLLSH